MYKLKRITGAAAIVALPGGLSSTRSTILSLYRNDNPALRHKKAKEAARGDGEVVERRIQLAQLHGQTRKPILAGRQGGHQGALALRGIGRGRRTSFRPANKDFGGVL